LDLQVSCVSLVSVQPQMQSPLLRLTAVVIELLGLSKLGA
jgi:hypothetical protein